MMGSGKCSTARELSKRWEAAKRDTDAEVSWRTGCSIAELWSVRGEKAFRDMEQATVAHVATGTPAIIATGGGVVLRGESVDVMRASGKVAWLTAAPETLSDRLTVGGHRPLLAEDASARRLTALLTDRRGLYESAAHWTIDTEGLSVAEGADRIEAWWNSL